MEEGQGRWRKKRRVKNNVTEAGEEEREKRLFWEMLFPGVGCVVRAYV